MKSWQALIEQEQNKAYFQALQAKVATERAQGRRIFPADDSVFAAFAVTPLEQVKVVILGQDPYHGLGQAHGLCFSVPEGIKIPPSLVNIYKELATDIEGFNPPKHGDLRSWAQQGVLLLNTVLTVEEGKAHSHAKWGWECFTDEVLLALNQCSSPIIFVLWGAHAIKKGKVITASQHTILQGPHPSPLSAYRGFFGCKHFSTINGILLKQGDKAIDWQV
ncbi:Uracil-DNA glycosylase [Shewanella denitrificans OS217]|jgi:uracil-DNA glycosylase|uniref:Uracil-DNA glycosylase n=1 Tax=Shewanella denitrificans (strain OS217 / ATCC BAA-1090 / DSM 15013) TaxID=318161 RepID=Q12K19_SHEDO|nr:uracil-DNA glycosylase [Shewanella denitrificans]ABE56207.1 Uracil-DNA glycosylase [Shewanella denitrificans OS217]